MTLYNYKFILFDWQLTRDAIWNSVSLGFSAALITMFAGVIISYVIVKMKVRGKASWSSWGCCRSRSPVR
jgi:iron(III) transport system permease protein